MDTKILVAFALALINDKMSATNSGIKFGYSPQGMGWNLPQKPGRTLGINVSKHQQFSSS